VPNRLIEF